MNLSLIEVALYVGIVATAIALPVYENLHC